MSFFERARALKRHAQYCGAPLEQFVLELTEAECWQALAWLQANIDPRLIDPALLSQALDEARRDADPWEVMNDFTILGLQVVRRQGELH